MYMKQNVLYLLAAVGDDIPMSWRFAQVLTTIIKIELT